MTLSAGIALAQPPAAPVTPVANDPFAFFEPQIAVSADERARLAKGEALVKPLAPGAREVAMFSAIAADFNGDRLVSWMRRIDALKKSSYAPIVTRFSDPPRIEDLAALDLDEDDINELRTCRPASCGLKLGDEEIRTLSSIGAARKPGWQDETQRAFRQVMLARATGYLQKGLMGAPPYRDRSDPVMLDAEFQLLLKGSGFLTQRLPVLAEFMTRFPEAPSSNVESFLYWSKERLGGRPIVSITHLAIGRHSDDRLPEVVVVSRQVFGTHYVTGSLAMTALVGGRGGAPGYLVYLNRSRVDLLDGIFGGLIRRLMERRVRADAGEVVDGLRRRISGGEPPPETVADGR